MSENMVKLNVGGTVFQTTKSTLTKFDGMFRTMFETDVPVEKSASGEIFIDRDPTHFRIILNFMRDGDVNLPKSEESIEEISREAQYYLLEELVELCDTSLRKYKRNADSNIFKFLKDDNHIVQVVANSDKPVLIVLLEAYDRKLHQIHNVSKWKMFIQKHEDEWNIFFKANSKYELDWKFYSNENYYLGSGLEECKKAYNNYYSSPRTGPFCKECFYPKTIIDHLEFHMNKYLDDITARAVIHETEQNKQNRCKALRRVLIKFK